MFKVKDSVVSREKRSEEARFVTYSYSSIRFSKSFIKDNEEGSIPVKKPTVK